jgi:hypothetical protein
MPILRIIKRQMSPSQYDAAAAELDLDRAHPLGLIMHGATQTGDAMEIAQVWESAAYALRSTPRSPCSSCTTSSRRRSCETPPPYQPPRSLAPA